MGPYRHASGRVVLVGAGPGDAELITVRGLGWLRRAEVVVYDQLVDRALLAEAPYSALRIFAGKSAARHCVPQAAIHGLLIHHALAGQTVVRLKGGDPFVFGRGGEEALACRMAGVECDVVPGVSSSIAAPAAAGIPLTHRGLSSSFAVVTGHEDPTKSGGRVNWERLATAVDTLIVLMGVAALPVIAARLIRGGRDPRTPAAVVRWGTTEAQDSVAGTLADIAERSSHLAPPAVIVVGDVVNLRVTSASPPGSEGRPRRGRASHAGWDGPGSTPPTGAAPRSARA